MNYLNDWHDWVRLVVLLINVYALVTLVRRYRKGSDGWNTKTLDYWYAFFMWCAAGAAVSAQGIYLDRPFTPAVVFITAATLVTGKGLHKKGSWGGDR